MTVYIREIRMIKILRALVEWHWLGNRTKWMATRAKKNIRDYEIFRGGSATVNVNVWELQHECATRVQITGKLRE